MGFTGARSGLGRVRRALPAELAHPHCSYGWAMGLLQLLLWGSLFYGFGILLPEIHAETGLSLAFLSGMPTTAALAGAAVALPLGRYWRNGNAHRSFLAGIAAGGAALALWAMAGDPWHFMAVAGLLGISQVLCLYDGAFMLVRRHIRVPGLREPVLKRVTLLGGLASAVLVPFVATASTLWSWRGALLLLAALLITIALPLAWRLAPVHRKGQTERTDSQGSDPFPGFRMPVAAGTLEVWTFGMAATSAAVAAILPASLLARGYPEGSMVLLVSILGATKLAGRLLVGPLASGVGLGPLLWMTAMAAGLGLAALGSMPLWAAWLGVPLGGLALGMNALLRPLALEHVARNSEHFARANGRLAGLGLFAHALGPVSAGLLLDRTAGGALPLQFLALAVAGVGVLVAALMTRAKRCDELPELKESNEPTDPTSRRDTMHDEGRGNPDHPGKPSAIQCDLNAIHPEERKAHEARAQEVLSRVEEVRELHDGYALRLAADPDVLGSAGRFMARERLCCPFFRFALVAEGGEGPAWLELRGGSAVKEFLEHGLVAKLENYSAHLRLPSNGVGTRAPLCPAPRLSPPRRHPSKTGGEKCALVSAHGSSFRLCSVEGQSSPLVPAPHRRDADWASL